MIGMGCVPEPATIELWTCDLELPNASTRAIALPIELDLPSRRFSFVLRSEVHVPVELRSRDLQLVLPYYQGRVSLLVNGRKLPRRDARLESMYAPNVPHAWTVPP